MRGRLLVPHTLLLACVAILTSCSTNTSTPDTGHRKFSVSDRFYPSSPDGTRNEGVVDVNVCIAANSTLESANILNSSGHQDLDDAALAIMHSGRYKAGTEDGHPVRGCRKLRVTFDAKKNKSADLHDIH
jgi:TonB family protein